MTYNEFLDSIREQVSEKIEDEYTVRILPVRRNNGVMLDSLMISKPGDMMSPNIYLNSLYDWYCSGTGIDRIADRILMQYRNAMPEGSVDIGAMMNRETVCKNTVYRVINTSRNRDILEDIPHREFLDLSLVYYTLIRNSLIGEGAVLIHREHQKMWGLSDEEIERAAQENTKTLLPYELLSISEMIGELSKSLDNRTYSDLDTDRVSRYSPLYVLTNKDRQFGAFYLTDKHILNTIAEAQDDNLYILPSSVHECIVLPERYEEDPEDLSDMVMEINRTQVPEEAFLSDSVYYYDRIIDEIDIAA